MPKEILIPAQEAKTRYRVISQISYSPDSHITLTLMVADLVNGKLTIDHRSMPERLVIAGDAYAELLSNSPEWNPNKDENYYNESDLWHIIEMIETGAISSIVPVVLTPEG